MGITYAIIASLLQGVGYTLLKKSFEELPSSVSFAVETIFAIFIWVSYSLLSGIDWSQVLYVLPFTLLSALLSEAFVFYSLSKGEICITSAVFSTYPVFTVMLSRIVNGEAIPLVTSLFIVVTMIGIVVMSLPPKFSKKDIANKMYILWPLLAAISVGISDTISKRALMEIDSSTFLFCLALCQIPVAVGYLRAERTGAKFIEVTRSLKPHRITLLSSFSISGSMVFFWLAFEEIEASIASPVTATYMLFVLLFSWIFYGSLPRRIELGGIFLTIAGVIGVSIFAS